MFFLIIFGANGDLTKRLLVPALYNLAGGKLLADKSAVLGVDRGEQVAAAIVIAPHGYDPIPDWKNL